MTLQEMLILYVGESDDGEAVRAAAALAGGCVHLPDHMLQALGMYITYLPNVIIIDSAVSYGDEVLMHLRSVDARPILLLTDEPNSAHSRTDGVFVVDRDCDAGEILEAARQIASGGTLLRLPSSNGYRRTG